MPWALEDASVWTPSPATEDHTASGRGPLLKRLGPLSGAADNSRMAAEATTSPTHPIAQVHMALAKRILGGELDDSVAPVVAEVMTELETEISAAIASDQTNRAREGALAVVAVLVRELDALV